MLKSKLEMLFLRPFPIGCKINPSVSPCFTRLTKQFTVILSNVTLISLPLFYSSLATLPLLFFQTLKSFWIQSFPLYFIWFTPFVCSNITFKWHYLWEEFWTPSWIHVTHFHPLNCFIFLQNRCNQLCVCAFVNK